MMEASVDDGPATESLEQSAAGLSANFRNADEKESVEGRKSTAEDEAATNLLETETNKERRLNCNLCDNIFATIPGLNVHMKSHPEVVVFELQLLDNELHDRDGFEDQSLEDVEDSEASTTQIGVTKDVIESTPERKKLRIKAEKKDDNDYIPDKPKRLARGRPAKRAKSARLASKLRKQPSVSTKEQTLEGKIKTEPADNPANNHGEDTGYHCRMCDKSFQSLNGRDLHEKKHSGNYKFKCNKCGKGFNSKHHFQQHLNMHNQIKPHMCSKCSKTFASKQKWKLHERKCDPSQPKPIPQYLQKPEQKPCPFCGKLFIRPDSLKSHIAVQHTEGGKTRFKCDGCGRTFSQKGALRVHQRNPRACLKDLLDAKADWSEDENKANLEVNCFGGKPFKCDECDTACATADGLEMHRRKHTGNYPFRCEECGKGFNSNVALEGHLNKHNGIKPHVCEKCGKGFYHVSNLQRHFRYCDPEKLEEKSKVKIVEKEHICPFCGKLLQTAGGLLLHMNKHTGQFPFNCTICGKGYNSNMLLKAHMDSHLNVKGYVCQHCGKNFRHKSNLNRHLSYCDPEKQAAEGGTRFPCDLCDKTYLRKESLTEHKISKHSAITFDCNVCGKVYDSRGSLFWHKTKSFCAKGISSGEPTPRRRKIKQEQLEPQLSAAQVLQAAPLQQQQQQQQQQFQHVPNDVVLEFPPVSQALLGNDIFSQQTQQQSQQMQQAQPQITIGSGAIHITAAEPSTSLPGLETLATSQDLDSSNKSMITLMPYQNIGQKTYFSFS